MYFGKRDPFRRNEHQNQSLGKLDCSVNVRVLTMIQVNIFDHIIFYYIVLFFHPLRYSAGGSKDETERKTRKITDNKRCFFYYYYYLESPCVFVLRTVLVFGLHGRKF